MARKPMVKMVVTGDKAIDRKLRKLSLKVQKKIARKAARAAMRPVHASAIQLAPKDTSELANGIKLRAGKAKGKRRGSIIIEVRTEGEHAHIASFIEFGTQHKPAAPFMRPALDINAIKSRAIMLKTMWDGIKQTLR